ncbi:MAG: acyl-CoA dehydrogenase [Halieaceae bacterium]|nr:acyl-CoA dehydrogenase [Halieaceae bacterium]
MNLTFTDTQEAFRQEAREWLKANVPDEPLKSFDTEEGFQQHREWEAKLNEGRWGMVTWPEDLGGRGCDLIEWLVFEEEYYRAGAPLRVNQNGIFLLGPTLMEYGTDAQKARFLPKMATGEEIWCQGWSEPNAGSDMAAIRSRADRDGDHYVINGQKTWSTRAVWADWCFGMFRTDPESERHRGLTFILVPLDTPGITVRPIPQLDGLPGFAEIFFDDVRVPVDCRLGGEGDGWSVAMATAGFERGLLLRSPARFQETARRLVELYKCHRASADRDPAVKAAVMQAWMDAEAYCLTTYQTACRMISGGKIGAEASTNKIFWSELDQAMHATALSILGARAELMSHAPDAGDVGNWLDGWLFSQSGPIYAGTNEIQRNIIAERMLGMPR